MKTLFKLLVALLLLTGTMVSDGGSCIPWTPTTCPIASTATAH